MSNFLAYLGQRERSFCRSSTGMLRSESPAAAGRESPAKQGVNVNFRAQREIFIIACAIVLAFLFAFLFVYAFPFVFVIVCLYLNF